MYQISTTNITGDSAFAGRQTEMEFVRKFQFQPEVASNVQPQI